GNGCVVDAGQHVSLDWCGDQRLSENQVLRLVYAVTHSLFAEINLRAIEIPGHPIQLRKRNAPAAAYIAGQIGGSVMSQKCRISCIRKEVKFLGLPGVKS